MTHTGLLLIAALALVPSHDGDRPPNAEERAAIERVLAGNAFVAWDEIELDDGRWEVDDARLGDGRYYDLVLAVDTLRIVRRERERERDRP